MDLRINILRDLQQQKKSIHNQLNHGIIDSVNAMTELELIEKKERNLIKQLVLNAHVTADGTPRKITYQESKGLYYTLLANKKKIYATSLDIMYDKLFTEYGLSITDYSFKAIFDLALIEKAKTRNRNPETIYHNQSEYNRFIDGELGKKDVRKITKYELQEYSQSLVNRLNLTVNAFKAYKGVLNIVFNYAMEHEIISSNPVPYINNHDYYTSCIPSNSCSEKKILSEHEISIVINTVRQYMTYSRYHGYFVNGYAILMAIESGMRAGELASLKWEDIHDTYIHIHTQQLSIRKSNDNAHLMYTQKFEHWINKGKIYYIVPWTKGEKGVPNGGRKFPLTDRIKSILSELKAVQDKLNIKSCYVFANRDEAPIKTDAYETCLRRMLQSLGFNVTNNHAFRMSLNSNVFIGKLQLPVTERANLLGHSVETNEKHYSFSKKDNIDNICSLLNEMDNEIIKVSPRSHLKLVKFTKEKSLETANFKAL